jgi:hypothetical protein
MAATKFTATLPDGTTITRTSKTKTYSHVVISELVSPDGTSRFIGAEWASRSDLAQKNAAKWDRNWAKQVGKPGCVYFPQFNSYRVHQIPVN